MARWPAAPRPGGCAPGDGCGRAGRPGRRAPCTCMPGRIAARLPAGDPGPVPVARRRAPVKPHRRRAPPQAQARPGLLLALWRCRRDLRRRLPARRCGRLRRAQGQSCLQCSCALSAAHVRPPSCPTGADAPRPASRPRQARRSELPAHVLVLAPAPEPPGQCVSCVQNACRAQAAAPGSLPHRQVPASQ